MTETDPETTRPAGRSSAGLSRWVLELPYRRPELNLNEVKGRHWSRTAGTYHNLVEAGYYLARHRKLPRPILSTVTVELIYWPGNNTVHDPDNMGLMLKGLLDGVRQAGALRDDRGRFVRSTTCTVIERADDPEGRRDARLVLVIQEVGPSPRFAG